ncbi:endonuclease VII domain-containing protein [Nocardia sp. NPDC056611]|uniref:endonuclease VII domain-containing protein n=1 Tax=Nocardia sp. NPDC056611 TaxID=3345877 RepID=UPI00367338B4
MSIKLFARARDKKSGRTAHCSDCQKKAREGLDERSRTEKKLRRFGLTWAEYQAMIKKQKNLCAICKRPEDESYSSARQKMYGPKPLSIDHCHTTGSVRELLCSACNFAIGKMGDNPDRLRAAAQYLHRFREGSE